MKLVKESKYYIVSVTCEISKTKQNQLQQKLSPKKFIRPSGITKAETDKTLKNRSISCVFTFVAQMV